MTRTTVPAAAIPAVLAAAALGALAGAAATGYALRRNTRPPSPQPAPHLTAVRPLPRTGAIPTGPATVQLPIQSARAA